MSATVVHLRRGQFRLAEGIVLMRGRKRLRRAVQIVRRLGIALALTGILELAKSEAGGQPVASSSAPETAHWSLQPLHKTEPPKTENRQWPRTALDQFVLAQLEARRMRPNPPADRRTLLRRINFDLIGLPPTLEEQRAFLADNSAKALENVVDRLLASPRYGERWARHWMDVVHFAETHGNDQDRIRTNAWPYRDYLIRSLNEDKPYARFVQEQLAGDVLFAQEPQATIALGFLAAGPWDESSLRDIREDTLDRQIARYLDRDDMVATVMSTFASATAHCARCHDHKFDPISQEDYYSLQAVFAGIDRAERAFDPDPAVHASRQALLKKRRALEAQQAGVMASLLEPAMQSEVAAWERALATNVVSWTVLEPMTFVSSNGTTLTRQADGSILAGGVRPEKDVYAISAQPDLKGITAMRLEVLTDDSLPQKGPGRQDNGNLHLSELKILTSPGAGSEPKELGLQHPTADFNQQGWTIEHAIDRKEKTAWGIHPEVGKPHHAVFELKEDYHGGEGVTWTFILEQNHGGGHLIGRLRLSVTTASRPVRVGSLPGKIADLLAVPARERTSAQKQELASYHVRNQIEAKLAALPKPQLVYAGASDFAPDGGLVPAKAPRPIHVLRRGDINKPGDEASPGALSAIRTREARFALSNPGDEGSRRAALAEWIVDPKNPLTWRSIVNRVWHYHFGRGIVDTPNDFGKMGGLPSHPELLDWLAGWFLEQGGSFKRLHKLILMSAAYQQSAMDNPAFARLDFDNRSLWRMNRSRLDAESVRDAILQLTDQLDPTMGGPSVKQFSLSPGIHVTPVVDYAKFDVDSRDNRRRSIYRFLFRTLPDPFMDSLDCPEASQLAPVRGASVTALQALSMLNNHFVVRQSERFAERVAAAEKNLPSQIRLAYELALGRPPSKDESKDVIEYAKKHGMANLCRLLLNSNEFMFVN
jgi:hypothetical protein